MFGSLVNLLFYLIHKLPSLTPGMPCLFLQTILPSLSLLRQLPPCVTCPPSELVRGFLHLVGAPPDSVPDLARLLIEPGRGGVVVDVRIFVDVGISPGFAVGGVLFDVVVVVNVNDLDMLNPNNQDR